MTNEPLTPGEVHVTAYSEGTARFREEDGTWYAEDDALPEWTGAGATLAEVMQLHREAKLVYPLQTEVSELHAALTATRARLAEVEAQNARLRDSVARRDHQACADEIARVEAESAVLLREVRAWRAWDWAGPLDEPDRLEAEHALAKARRDTDAAVAALSAPEGGSDDADHS